MEALIMLNLAMCLPANCPRPDYSSDECVDCDDCEPHEDTDACADCEDCDAWADDEYGAADNHDFNICEDYCDEYQDDEADDEYTQCQVEMRNCLEKYEQTLNRLSIHYSALCGTVPQVEARLKKGSRVNQRNKFRETPLHLAVEARHPEMVRVLLDKGAKPNARNRKGETALFYAATWQFLSDDNGEWCQERNAQTFDFSVFDTFDVNVQNKSGETPLMAAATLGNAKLVRYLTDRDADVNIVAKDGGATALHLAAVDGDADTVETLLNAGANPNFRDGDFNHALLHALQNGNLSAAKLLVAGGADVSVANNRGGTPLHLAVLLGDAALCGEMIGKGARLDALDANGRTPMEIAEANRLTDIIYEALKYTTFDDYVKDAAAGERSCHVHQDSRTGAHCPVADVQSGNQRFRCPSCGATMVVPLVNERGAVDTNPIEKRICCHCSQIQPDVHVTEYWRESSPATWAPGHRCEWVY